MIELMNSELSTLKYWLLQLIPTSLTWLGSTLLELKVVWDN